MLLIARLLLLFGIVAMLAVAGAVVAFFGSFALAMLAGADNMNGGLAMGAAGIAPVGGVIGAGLGAWVGWRQVTRLGKPAILASGFGLAGIAVLAAGAWYLHDEMTDGNPYDPDAEPVLLIEWRLPEQVPHDRVDAIYRFTMRSSYMDWTLNTAWDTPRARDEDGRTILRMRGNIRWRVDGRTFQLWKAPDHDDRLTVDLGLPRDPETTGDYGPWQEVAEAPGFAFRTRIVRD